MYSLLDFYNVTFWPTVFKIFVIILVYFLHNVVGKIFFPTYGFFIQAFIGFSFSAGITASLCAFNAIAARFFVLSNIIIILVLNVLRYWKKAREKTPKLTLKYSRMNTNFGSVSIFSFSFVFLFLLFILESAKVFSEQVTVNSHQTYFAGVPLEILQADYAGRLRILDNYPLEYPRFHFFRGAGIANLLPLIKNPSFFDYQLANICILAGLAAIVYESAKMRHIKVGFMPVAFWFLLSTTFLANQLQWTILGNNFPSIAVIICVLLLGKMDLDRRLVFSLLLIMSCTASRNFFPALCMLLVLTYSVFKIQGVAFFSPNTFQRVMISFKEVKSFKYFVAVFVFVDLTMLLTGASLFGLLRPKTWITQPIQNLLPMDWLSLMSPSLALVNLQARDSIFTTLKPTPVFFFLMVVIAVLLIFAQAKALTIRGFLKKELKFRLLTLGFCALTILSTLLYVNGLPEFSWFLCYFLIPIIAVALLFEGNRQRIVSAFLVSSFGQIFVFIAGASIPNWILIEWLLVFIVIEKTQTLKLYWQGLIVLSFVIPMVLQPSSFLKPNSLFELNPLDSQTHSINLNSYKDLFSGNHVDFYCRGSDEEGLLSSLKGIRTTYNEEESHNYTVTADFGRLTPADSAFIVSVCN